MRTALLLLVLACTLLMTGCVTLSVYPLYTPKDLVGDLALEGKWTDPDGKEIWDFRKAGDMWLVTELTRKDGEVIELRLVKLGERTFLDVTANNAPSLAVAGHIFGKIRLNGNELEIQLMGASWLEKAAREAGLPQVALPDKDVLVTAPTADLQKFVLAHADDPEAFEAPGTLHRIR